MKSEAENQEDLVMNLTPYDVETFIHIGESLTIMESRIEEYQKREEDVI